jgi:hypothetical protein
VGQRRDSRTVSARFRGLSDAICANSFRCASEVKHLICIDNSDGNSLDEDYMQTVFAADKTACFNIAYEARYYYDHVNIIGDSFIPFPFYLVTDRYLLLIAHDLKKRLPPARRQSDCAV